MAKKIQVENREITIVSVNEEDYIFNPEFNSPEFEGIKVGQKARDEKR